MVNKKVNKLKEMIERSDNIVAFTGAGASTESDIPDFRSDDGLYNRIRDLYDFPPEKILSKWFFENRTEEFYKFYKEHMIFKDVKPNAVHTTLARLEKKGKLKSVVTQNVDNLHLNAGSKTVYELHGNAYRNYCQKCGAEYTVEYILNYKGDIPACTKCDGIIKPDVVLYQEGLDDKIIKSAISSIKNSDMLLIIGTSLSVYPAAGLIDYYTKDRFVIINKTKTPYDNKADLLIHRKAGTVMSNVI